MTTIYFLYFLVALVRGPFALAAFLPRDTTIIALVGISPPCTLRLTPASLRLSTVLSRICILRRPWSGDVVTTLVIAAPTPASLRLSTVLSRILRSPWSGDMVTTLAIAAPTNLSESPSARLRRQSPIIRAVEPALAGEQTALFDNRSAALAGLVDTDSGDS